MFVEGQGILTCFSMKAHAEAVVSDEKFAGRHDLYPEDTPDTKEAYYIREIFDGSVTKCRYLLTTDMNSGLFPSKAAASTAVRWIPRKDWGCATDPSGRSVKIHNSAYEDK